MTTMDITEFSLEHEDDRGMAVVWRDNADRADEATGREESDGTVVVRLGVDGMFDIAEAHLGISDPVESLDRTIDTLTRIRDTLAGFPRRQVRACLARSLDSGGRCKRRAHGDDDHDFPTDEEVDKAAEATARARALRSA